MVAKEVMHRGGPTATGRGVVFDQFSFGLRDPSQLGKEGASFDPGALPLLDGFESSL